MEEPSGYTGIAYNGATASENRIHSDDVARQYGFRGGLVPGVTVYAYLVEPAVRVWGLDWLERGAATVTLRKPLYERCAFRVDVESESDGTYRGRVYDADDVLCADGRVTPPCASASRSLPVRRGDPAAPVADGRPDATRPVLEALFREGLGGGDALGALRGTWTGTGDNDRYHDDLANTPDLVRPDREGWAHPGYTLGLANWILGRNVRLGPWIHVESEVRHHAPLSRGTEFVVEARIKDLFDKRGHEFVDLDVEVYGADDAPLLSAFHRAIYRLREPQAEPEA